MSTHTDPMDVEPDSAALGGGGEESRRDGGGGSSRGGSSVGGAPAAAAVVAAPLRDASQQHKLLRDPSQGMNPINLATGIYGPRGERIRHVVHEGSLRLPAEALALLGAQQEGSEGSATSSRERPMPSSSSPRPSIIVLPGLDSVVRPSLDLDLPTVIVTDVMSAVAPQPPPALHGDNNSAVALSVVEPAAVTVARNRVVTFAMAAPAAATTSKAPPGHTVAVAAASQPPSARAVEPERIRGGGDDDDDDERGGDAPAPPATEPVPKPAAGGVVGGGSSAEPPGGGGAPMRDRDPSFAASAVAQVPHAATSTSSKQAPADPTPPALMPTPRPAAAAVALPPSQPSAGSDTRPTPQPNTVPPPPFNVDPSAPPQQEPPQHPPAPHQVATAAAGPSQPQPLVVPSSGVGSASSVAPTTQGAPLRGPAPQAPTVPLSSVIATATATAPASTAAASGPMQLHVPPPPSAVPATTAVAAPAQGPPVSMATVNFGSALASLAPASSSSSSSAARVPPPATANPIVQAAAPPPQPQPAGTMSQPMVRSAFSPPSPSVAATAGVHPTPTPAVATPVPPPMASSSAPPTQVPSTGGIPVSVPPIATAGPSRSAVPIPPTAPSSGAQAAPIPTGGPTVSASASAPQPSQAATQPSPQPKVIPLKDRPNAQWEQHIPGPNEESQVDPANKTPKPEWYTSSGVSELERTVLYEWFDGSAPHRTPESYVAAREKVLEMSGKLGTRYITSTTVRRTVVGDVTSLTRLHDFLTTHALINEDSQNDSAPTPWCLQDDKTKRSSPWTDEMKDALLEAVVEQSRRAAKRPRLLDGTRTASPTIGHGPTAISIDWEEVSRRVGHGVGKKECEREFLALPIAAENDSSPATATDRPITPDEHGPLSRAGDGKSDSSHGRGETAKSPHPDVLQEILDGCDPDLARAVTESALQLSGGSLRRAQAAGRAGLVLSRAVEVARSREDAVAHLLSELVDLRMKKLENRLAALDDIEGMLEAERVALELERRDLYTARCRHWFGGP